MKGTINAAPLGVTNVTGTGPMRRHINFVKSIHFSYHFFDPTKEHDGLPPAVQAVVDTVHMTSPGWTITVWGPTPSRALMETAPYNQWLDMYDAFPHGIQRSDMSRYAILHAHGGVYMDIDYVLTAGMGAVVQFLATHYPKGEAFVNGTPNTVIVPACSNSFMVARQPGHPFWLEVLRRCKVRPIGSPNEVIESAGPRAVHRAYRASQLKMSIRDQVVRLPTKVFNPCSLCDTNHACRKSPDVLAYHVNAGSWHKVDGTVKCLNRVLCALPVVWIALGYFTAAGLLVAVIILFVAYLGQLHVHRRPS
jgi:mannosyltransferase OCH1-like enzyme